MGDAFREADHTSPYGYFEDLDWRYINKRLLNDADGTWYDPPTRNAISKVATSMRMSKMINELVDKRDVEHDVWGFKDPRTCLTMHALHEYFFDHRYIYIARDERDVVRSLMARAKARGYEESPEHWRALRAEYNRRVVEFLEYTIRPVCIIRYERLISVEYVTSQIKRLAAFVDCVDEFRLANALQKIKFKW